ncbi:polyprenyl synthetase family protein [Bacillus tuaregi]|uniref:polyprenyl synthetase family protein n=1 Tax=Bacillus tuaregi TaxID=1816695 RepID=UPI0008F8C987|nr:polyprenyl synthetase family protein [Bacillus tuaregi]
MTDVTNRIIGEINTILGKEIQQENLKETIQKYINAQTKKGFPFAKLTILHYQMLDGTELDKVISVAAAIELLILSFDILDDIEDDDDNQKLWMNEQSFALNASTAMIFICIDVIRKTDLKYKERAISILLEYSLLSISGQQIDLLSKCRTEKEYIEMALKKSGSLVSLACLVGANLASDQYLEIINRYSQFIGLIGQLNNDIYDLQNWEGKNDLLNKKLSLPVIYLLGYQGNGAEIISSYYNGAIEKDEMVKNQKFISKMIVDSGVLVYTEIIKRVYQNKVKTELQKLNVDKKFIGQLLDYIH